MNALQALKLEDPEGGVLLVTRVDDVGYTLVLSPALDEDGNPLPFRILDDDPRRQLREFLKSLA